MSGQKTSPAPVIVALPSQIDITSQERAYDRLYTAFACGTAVVIADFTGTASCDCAMLRRLVSVRDRAAARDAELRVVIPPGGVMRQLATLLDLDHLLPVYPALGEALAAGTLPVRNTPGVSRPIAARTVAMTDIIDLIAASQQHVLRWQAWFEELDHSPGAPAPARLGPGATWDTVTELIALHMAADDEVCAPAIYRRTPQGRLLARNTQDAHAEIGEMIAETSLQLPGTTPWWRLATATLAAWSRQYHDEEHGPPGQCRLRADRALRQQLGRQWRAFRQAWIRDLSYPDMPSQLPTCQLRLACPATPRLADPVFCPLACTCQACDGQPAGIRTPRFSPGHGECSMAAVTSPQVARASANPVRQGVRRA